MKELTLSEKLKLWADQLEEEQVEGLTPGERQESRKAQEYISLVAKYIVMSREVLLNEGLSQLDSLVQQEKDLVENMLDEHYALRLIEEVPSMVERTLQLSRLTALQTPSRQTNRYISEAMRSYIQGFPVASIAISRAAFEQALKEKLGRQGDGEYQELRKLVDDARKWNILSPTGYIAAKDLIKMCNRVLHEEPMKDEEKSLEILVGIRALLEELYSKEGHC